MLVEEEGVAKTDATWAADAAKVDWKAQVGKAAKALVADWGYSRLGLIDELVEWEGHNKADSIAAVDALKLDYNAQAKRAAQGYLEVEEGWTKAEMIDQLIYDRFTSAQAKYGATAVGL